MAVGQSLTLSVHCYEKHFYQVFQETECSQIDLLE